METRAKKLKLELINWYKNNKRSFSWRKTTDPWQILLIETLAQQTQLERANEYFKKFSEKFSSPKSMANSSLKIILQMWSGLGYNNRAVRLYEASKIIEKKVLIKFILILMTYLGLARIQKMRFFHLHMVKKFSLLIQT